MFTTTIVLFILYLRMPAVATIVLVVGAGYLIGSVILRKT